MAEAMRIEDWALLEDYYAAPRQAREEEPTHEELSMIEAAQDGGWLADWV